MSVAMSLIAISMQSSAAFRGFEFGTSFQDVTREERAEFHRSTPTLAIFSDEIFGFNTQVVFHFNPETDALVAGTYDVECIGYEIDEILDHFMKVMAVFEEKYGKCMKSGEIWWTDRSQYKDDLVNAFRFAEVAFRKEWYGPGLVVTISLRNELNTQGRIVYTIEYVPGRPFDPESSREKL